MPVNDTQQNGQITLPQSENHTSNGRFKKGNKAAKKDFTKEMAQHVTWRELYHTARLMTEVSTLELKRMSESGLLADESILTYSILKKVVGGDMKALQFLIEMIVGKPKQQIEGSSTGKITINIDSDDASL